MKLKRKTPSRLFPSPYKTKYTRYPIHFYISPFFQKIERIWILSAGIGVKIELFNIVLETCEDYMENSVKNSEQFALFSFSE